jgi:hypothetical protein
VEGSQIPFYGIKLQIISFDIPVKRNAPAGNLDDLMQIQPHTIPRSVKKPCNVSLDIIVDLQRLVNTIFVLYNPKKQFFG